MVIINGRGYSQRYLYTLTRFQLCFTTCSSPHVAYLTFLLCCSPNGILAHCRQIEDVSSLDLVQACTHVIVSLLLFLQVRKMTAYLLVDLSSYDGFALLFCLFGSSSPLAVFLFCPLSAITVFGIPSRIGPHRQIIV